MQRVTLNGQNSTCKAAIADVLRGSILGPLFFLVFINDLPVKLECLAKIFGEDTSLFSLISDHIQSFAILNRDLNQ